MEDTPTDQKPPMCKLNDHSLMPVLHLDVKSAISWKTNRDLAAKNYERVNEEKYSLVVLTSHSLNYLISPICVFFKA